MVLAIFSTSSPIHDGAVVIRGNRIAAAGVILPIAPESRETQGMGTRHRAAFWAASETDAVAVVVSEENGHVTVFSNRMMQRAETQESLRDILEHLFRKEGGFGEHG
jgi:diadenylate cyclase